MITKITNHISQALARLLQQYKGKIKLENLIRSIFGEIQVIEDTAFDVLEKGYLDNAFGQTLDYIGTIVGIEREAGEDDDSYRTSIKIKIASNLSQGEPERLITIFKLIKNANLVFISDDFHGEVYLASDVAITQEEVNDLVPRLQKLVGAGIRVYGLGSFDAVEPFSFAGTGSVPGRGYGSVYDASVGGKYATAKSPA